jgi:hypothetical protein
MWQSQELTRPRPAVSPSASHAQASFSSICAQTFVVTYALGVGWSLAPCGVFCAWHLQRWAAPQICQGHLGLDVSYAKPTHLSRGKSFKGTKLTVASARERQSHFCLPPALNLPVTPQLRQRLREAAHTGVQQTLVMAAAPMSWKTKASSLTLTLEMQRPAVPLLPARIRSYCCGVLGLNGLLPMKTVHQTRMTHLQLMHP